MKGEFFRALAEEAAEFALEDGPSFARDHRYNVRGRFGALYFGDRVEVCRATLQARGYLTARATRYVLLSFDIRVPHILDLTDPASYRLLGITRADLLKSKEIPLAYDLPNILAMGAYRSGRIRGILAPDVSETGSSLALFPARLLAKDLVKLKSQGPF